MNEANSKDENDEELYRKYLHYLENQRSEKIKFAKALKKKLKNNEKKNNNKYER